MVDYMFILLFVTMTITTIINLFLLWKERYRFSHTINSLHNLYVKNYVKNNKINNEKLLIDINNRLLDLLDISKNDYSTIDIKLKKSTRISSNKEKYFHLTVEIVGWLNTNRILDYTSTMLEFPLEGTTKMSNDKYLTIYELLEFMESLYGTASVSIEYGETITIKLGSYKYEQ